MPFRINLEIKVGDKTLEFIGSDSFDTEEEAVDDAVTIMDTLTVDGPVIINFDVEPN